MEEIDLDLGGGYRLRSLREDDVDELLAVALANTEHLGRWHSWAVDVQREETSTYVTNVVRSFSTGEALPGVITDGGAIVGSCGFNRVDSRNGVAEIGYWLAATHVGRGLMSAAVRALIAHGFDVVGLHRIEIQAAPENPRSRAIPERLGFTYEGTRREAERHPGRYGDLVVYSLLAHEWAAR